MSEEDAIRELTTRIQNRFSHDDIRDIYRIIHFLLEILTENEQYSHHYNKHNIVMQCLYRYYVSQPHSRFVVHSYSTYVSERLHEIKRTRYNIKKEQEGRHSSFCRYCIIS